MTSREISKIGGALASFWSGGDGPSRAQIQSALLIAGYNEQSEGNKQQLVLNAIVRSEDTLAMAIIEELVALLRESGYLGSGEPSANALRLQRTIRLCGHEMNDEGYVDWRPTEKVRRDDVPAEPLRVDPPRTGRSATTTEFSGAEVSSPNLDLLISSLRRLGAGAARPLIQRRRRGRPSLEISDEYDVQDVVEMLLKSLYNDVRHEEPTPSSAGSASRMDLHLREGGTAVEIKVTAVGRGERHIKRELLVDFNDYREHPTVHTLVAAIFDLAGTFDNPGGFEHDLSGMRDGLEVHVVVIPWVGPRSPEH